MQSRTATGRRLLLERQFDPSGRPVRLFVPPTAVPLALVGHASKSLPITSRTSMEASAAKKSDLSSRLEAKIQPPETTSRPIERGMFRLFDRDRINSSRPFDSKQPTAVESESSRKVQTNRRYNIKIMKDVFARRQQSP